jgi:hypothetical protein
MRLSQSLTLTLAVALAAPVAFGQLGIGPIKKSVPAANERVGTPDTVISKGFKLKQRAIGTDPLENPTARITQFGFLADGTRTEPDENLYMVSANPGGPTPGYKYGHHFLYQGHENGGGLAYITRINLDVKDPAHRITLLTPEDLTTGLTGFSSIDGSTYDPFTNTFLFTQENGANGGVIQVSATWPPVVTTLDGIVGKAGYEGIHPDDRGNLLIIEDVGGTSVHVDPNNPASAKTARQPNSFVYRFIPKNRHDLSEGGKLQALQVSIDGQPVVFGPDPVADTFSVAQLALHTPGTSYPVKWVTIHDTDVDGTDAFSANALAKTNLATPFKRPENAQFLPGSGYRTFFFCPTGDTDADAGNQPALAARGSWGSIFRVDLRSNRETGRVSIFVLGDAEHASFDNLTFADPNTLLSTEDRGDSLHAQLNKLDLVWAFSVHGRKSAKRFIALGLDASAAGVEDNEPTGLHVSNGSQLTFGQPGTLLNQFFARGFVTRQHGDNTVFEIVRADD